MTDWIDDEKRRRERGLNRALTQDEHAAVNARHTGCTRETCCECGEETGRAGLHEDSLFGEGGDGPYCEECWIATKEET